MTSHAPSRPTPDRFSYQAWGALLHKEFREHLPIVATLTLVTTLFPISGFLFTWWKSHDDGLGLAITMATCWGYQLVAPLVVGMRTATSESTHRTMPFLLGLPIPPWRIAACKLVCGLISVLAPLLVTLACMWSYHANPNLFGLPDMQWIQLADIVVHFVVVTVMLYLWIGALYVFGIHAIPTILESRGRVEPNGIVTSVTIVWCIYSLITMFTIWATRPLFGIILAAGASSILGCSIAYASAMYQPSKQVSNVCFTVTYGAAAVASTFGGWMLLKPNMTPTSNGASKIASAANGPTRP
jgi:hypothetical protein